MRTAEGMQIPAAHYMFVILKYLEINHIPSIHPIPVSLTLQRSVLPSLVHHTQIRVFFSYKSAAKHLFSCRLQASGAGAESQPGHQGSYC